MSEDTIDRKFTIEAYNPANEKTYTHENSLLLCAHDKAVPFALLAYKTACVNLGCSEEHIKSVELLIERVKKFQTEEGNKLPTTEGDAEIARCIFGVGV